MPGVRAVPAGSDAAPGVFERIVFTAQFGAGITAAMERRQQSSRSEPCAGFWRGTVAQRLAGR
jgi:hypothetical protein